LIRVIRGVRGYLLGAIRGNERQRARNTRISPRKARSTRTKKDLIRVIRAIRGYLLGAIRGNERQRARNTRISPRKARRTRT